MKEYPEIRYIDTDQVNAFYMWTPWDDVIAVTNGARNKLTSDEFRAIIAHERGHREGRHPQISLFIFASLMIEAVAMAMTGFIGPGLAALLVWFPISNVTKLLYELSADRYAASVCGARVIESALLRTLELNGCSPSRYMRARLFALRLQQ